MTPAQRHAHQASAASGVTEADARGLAAQLNAAIHLDNEAAGIDAMTSLFTGIAINIARIADVLTKDKQQ